MNKAFLSISILFISLNVKAQDSTSLRYQSVVINKQKTFAPQAIPKDLATKQFGFFCRQELKMEKQNLPVHFRLGSVAYCNWLEGKPGYSIVPPNK